MRMPNRSILQLSILVVSCLVIATCAQPANAQNSVGKPKTGTAISQADVGAAQTHNRILDVSQLSPAVKEVLGIKEGEVGPEAFGDMGHPFTTKRASGLGTSSPVEEFPWRAAGKMFMKFGDSTFVCTASVIRKGLLVTAAHCVHNFGQGQAGFADAIRFEPARHGGSPPPFGTWTAREWWIPTVYFNGSDVCSPQAPGIVCENDVAVVVLEKLEEKSIGEVVGMYRFEENDPDDDFGYPVFLGKRSGQITQLGYPAQNFDGDKMIRTDSLGYWDDPFNVIIGSNQTGGSSGGPWLMNFGIDTSFSGTPPFDNTANTVVATTSWGFVSGTAKVQGASRFSKNTAYTTQSNIESLVASACGANPDAC